MSIISVSGLCRYIDPGTVLPTKNTSQNVTKSFCSVNGPYDSNKIAPISRSLTFKELTALCRSMDLAKHCKWSVNLSLFPPFIEMKPFFAPLPHILLHRHNSSFSLANHACYIPRLYSYSWLPGTSVITACLLLNLSKRTLKCIFLIPADCPLAFPVNIINRTAYQQLILILHLLLVNITFFSYILLGTNVYASAALFGMRRNCLF